ncbi:S-layer homology domain-containing protein [Hominicoprocola fusiformis]
MREKKFGKRCLTWVLVLMMTLSLLPVSALAEDGEARFYGKNVTSTYARDNASANVATVKNTDTEGAVLEAEGRMEVPEEKLIFDKAKGVIKGIDADWLAENKDKPLSVTIPAKIDGVAVTTIGIQAFQHCNNLVRIDLSGTKITAIQKRAFYECTALKEVILPDSLEMLGNLENDGGWYTAGSIFYGCSNMESIRTESSDADATFELPETLKAIGKHTFYGCFKNDVKVVIPESVEEIWQEAFYYKKGSVDHITQIVLKRTDVSGYNTEAFDFRSGSSRMLVFANKTAYDNYKPRSAIKRIMTYPVEITFEGTDKTELHLNGKPLGYQPDNTTGFWELNDAYALPTAPGSGTPVDPKPGYEYVTGGGWKLRENDEVLDVTKNLRADQDAVTAVSGGGKYEILAPTISYLVDGKTEDVDADQPFTVTIGDGKEHSIGIQVDHPLLKEKQQGTDEDYVYFEYYWFDEVSLGDGTNNFNGPRSKEEQERFSTATSNVEIKYVDGEHNTIPIAKTEHARYEGSSYEGYNDYYLVVVFGYHVVNGKKADTPFYLSANNGIGVGNANATHGPHLLQVKVDEVRVITATADEHGKIDPAAGTVTVPKGESKTFTITPDSGYRIKDVLVDGVSVGAVSTYTFEDVVENHMIHATFARKHTPTPSTPTVEIPDDDALGLNTTDHFAYIVGYGNGEVRPQNNITRAEVATIFFRLLTDDVRDENLTKTNRYSDVAATSWYNTAVSTLSSMGIITGYPDGTFRPNAAITRAEFAAIAARFDNDGDKTAAKFSDIANHWARDEISIAYNNGWINGYPDGTFGPQRDITRAETMTLVNRVLNRQPETADDLLPDMVTWTDNADKNAWYYLAVQEATNSHYYEFKTNSQYEKWTELRETRDWSQLEK